jgi:CDP-diacylglycerol--glycerol-3-phosphate 3-phosphatidyltransferase
MRRGIPWFLVLFRLALAPLLLALAQKFSGWVLAAAITAAVLTDIFDGKIARRLNIATPALRQADSMVDVIFWLCMLGVAIRRAPDIFAAHWGIILALLLAETLCQSVCLIRFRRMVATHSYFAKSWGLILLLCFAAMFLHPAAWQIFLSCGYGIAVDAEILAILLRAQTYPVDVKFFRALA